MNRHYDKANRRLVYVEQAATPGMWDEHWSIDDASARKPLQPSRVARGSRWLTGITERYLRRHDGSVLEGGCASLGLYDAFRDEGEPAGFYQFALDHRIVVADLTRVGFAFCRMKRLAGLKGFKDEVGILRRPLQTLYDYRGQSIVIRGVRWLLDPVFTVAAGHTCLLVLRRV